MKSIAPPLEELRAFWVRWVSLPLARFHWARLDKCCPADQMLEWIEKMDRLERMAK